jgi:hypothetical protein
MKEMSGRKKNFDIMAGLVFDKFHRNLELRQKLLDTAGKYLEETNNWGDSWWGVDVKKKQGRNHLGTILMATRQFWVDSYAFIDTDDVDFGISHIAPQSGGSFGIGTNLMQQPSSVIQFANFTQSP